MNDQHGEPADEYIEGEAIDNGEPMFDGSDVDTRPARQISRVLSLPAHPVVEAQLLRETWVQGSALDAKQNVEFRLDSGAGCGHAQLSLLVDIDGERVAWEYIDVASLTEAWVNAIVDAHRAAAAKFDAEVAALGYSPMHDEALDDDGTIAEAVAYERDRLKDDDAKGDE